MKKFLSVFLILFLVISLAACAPEENDPPVDQGTIPAEDPEDNNLEDKDKDEDIDTETDEDKDNDTDEVVVEDETEDEPEDVNDDQDEDQVVAEDEDVNKDETEDKDEESQVKEQEVNLYFANLKYIETGDESLDHLKAEERTVSYEDSSLEEAVVKELLKGPEGDSVTSAIPETIKLLGVEVEGDTAYVDFSSAGLEGASLQETLTIDQILTSLFDLNTVDKVQFLVDGEKAESLMGHVTIDEPFEDTTN